MNGHRTARCGIAVAAIAMALGAACSAESGSGACAPVEQLLEPGGAGVHVLSDEGATFTHHPPTSGPHQLPAPESGVSADPIPEARQVSALEAGMVMVQYGDALSEADISALQALVETTLPAGETDARVIVAPAVGPMDGNAQVALTAWATRRLCTTVDLGAAQDFIVERRDAYVVAHDDATGG